MLGGKLAATGRAMPHHDTVRLERLKGQQCIFQAFAFGDGDCATAILIASALMIFAAISKTCGSG